MRAFRPSHRVPVEECEEAEEEARQANVILYRERAAAGLPLFENTLFAERSEPAAMDLGLSA